MADHEADRVADLRIMRVRRPETFAWEPVRALVLRGAEAACPLLTPEAIYKEIAARISQDSVGVFVGFHPKPAAVCVAFLPITAWAMGPEVAIAYSEDRALSRLVGARLRDWLEKNGHHTMVSLNFHTQHDDATVARVFRHAGKSTVVGSVVETRF